MSAAGQFRERITLQRAVSVPDGIGGFTRSWTKLATVWARVVPTLGKEVLLSNGLQGVQAYQVTIRFFADLRPDDRLIWGAKTMNIRSAADPEGRRVETVIFADAGVPVQ